jgi:transcription initiation factor IIE alpha subunit
MTAQASLFDSSDRVNPRAVARECRREALESLPERVLRDQHRAILSALTTRTLSEGMTDEEIQAATGLNPNAVRPRRGELVEAGYLRESGLTRRTASGRRATVWTLTGKVWP